MKKIADSFICSVESLIIILLFEAGLFVIHSVGKGIVPIDVFDYKGGEILLIIIFNIVYYLIYFAFYYLIIGIMFPQKVRITKTKVLKFLPIMILHRLCFDALEIALGAAGMLLTDSSLIYLPLQNILTVIIESIYLISLILLMLYSVKKEETSNFSVSDLPLWFFVIQLFIIIIGCILILKDYSYLNHITEKYIEDSIVLQGNIDNFKFNFQLQQIVLNSLVSFITFIVVKIRMSNIEDVADESNRSGKKVIKPVVNVVCAVFCIWAFLFVKQFWPYEMLWKFYLPERTPEVSVEAFTYDIYEMVHYRSMTERRENRVYHNVTVPVKYNNDSLFKIKCNSYEDIDMGNGRCIFITYDDDIFIAYSYNGEIVIYNAKAIQNLSKEDEFLTLFLRNLIARGYWQFFEYGAEYMQKYDSEFIAPYITDYSERDFSGIRDKDIRENYMQEFAKSLL